jgi:hypothetical protein
MEFDSESDPEISNEELAFIDIRARVLRAGFTEAQLNQTVATVGDSHFLVSSQTNTISPFS